MSFKKILGFFAIAIAGAGVSSASASCVAAANLYNKHGYECKWLSNSASVLMYSCSGRGSNWVLLPKGDSCTAVPTYASKVTSFTKTSWLPKPIAPALSR
jgi:hypothetical protein